MQDVSRETFVLTLSLSRRTADNHPGPLRVAAPIRQVPT